MNHHHRKVLQALYEHPVSSNIDFKQTESVLRELGAEIDNRSGARIGVTLNGHTAVFHHADHSLAKDEVARVRGFLETCGVKLEDYPLSSRVLDCPGRTKRVRGGMSWHLKDPQRPVRRR
jgi:hypothetical protein